MVSSDPGWRLLPWFFVIPKFNLTKEKTKNTRYQCYFYSQETNAELTGPFTHSCLHCIASAAHSYRIFTFTIMTSMVTCRLWPGNPSSPLSPWSPLSPLFPWSPLSPLSPWLPLSPLGPEGRKRYFLRKKAVLWKQDLIHKVIYCFVRYSCFFFSNLAFQSFPGLLCERQTLVRTFNTCSLPLLTLAHFHV